MVLVIDNYDSFTYNLSHYLEELQCHVTVKRNDMFKIEEVNKILNQLFNILVKVKRV